MVEAQSKDLQRQSNTESNKTSTAVDITTASEYNVIKSENDNREYKYIVLPNGIKILLISDDTTEKAAASVDVNIGFLVDPDDVPGIAHFCEHMLFLGTEKFPIENDFTQYLSQNGGRSNAYTAEEHTNYHFDVKHEALAGAIDRFAQFFLCPLFNQDATDRELNAIESEFQKNILEDLRRYWYIQNRTSRPGHVFHKFGTGNLHTLRTVPEDKKIDVRELLLKFHDEYYSSNIMSVVVLGKEPLPELEKIVVPLFTNVLNKEVTVPVYKEHPYGEDELQTSIKILTIKELKNLKLTFPLPDIKKFYRESPAHYISHLIGHEGEGSLLSLLKKCNWVNELGAGSSPGANGYGFFSIGMELSEDGLKHINDIITIVFQYIKMLQNEKPSEEIFMEMKMLDEMKFRFKDKSLPRPYVTHLAQSMHLYQPEDVLYGPYRVDTFDPQLIKNILSYLRPDNFRYYILSQLFEEEEVSLIVEHYNAKYSIAKIPQEVIKKWEMAELHPELHLPKKNLFIPDSLDIKVPRVDCKEKAVPTIIKDSNIMRVWYKADDTFYLPKSCLNLSISCPLAHSSPFHSNQLTIFVSLLKDALTEYGYDADLAGVLYSINLSGTGILIKISGYNDKQLVLLKEILKQMTTLTVKTERFEIIKKKLEESIRNVEANQPYQQIGSITCRLMEEFGWSPDEQLECLPDITEETMKLYLTQLFKYIYIECLFAGNLLLKEAMEIAEHVEKLLTSNCKSHAMLPVQHMLSREYKLPKGCSYLFEKRNKIHDLSCIQVYLQIGLQEIRKNVLLELFAEMIKEPCFDTLRTKEQLGYIVFSGVGRSVSVQGVNVLIQSDKQPSMVEHRIDTFLSSFRETLVNMSEAQFEDYVSSLETKKLEKPKRLSIEVGRYWGEILNKQYHFRRSKVEVEELHDLIKDDVLEFYDKFISPSSKERKKLATVILGKDVRSVIEDPIDEKEPWNVISDILKFKSRLPLYSFVQPFNDVPLLMPTKSKL